MGRMSTHRPVVVFTHSPIEGPGRIAETLNQAGVPVRILNVVSEEDPQLPDYSELSGIVSLGGPMGALDYTDWPGIEAEAKYQRHAIAEGVPILAVCLGHQILATALGARLEKDAGWEIGIERVRRVCPAGTDGWNDRQTPVLEWHHDRVSLPKGATLLADSEATMVEGFRFGSALALQFHVEQDAAGLETWLGSEAMSGELSEGRKNEIRRDFARSEEQMRRLADGLFSSFTDEVLTYDRKLDGEQEDRD